jgi:hypothetical protein
MSTEEFSGSGRGSPVKGAVAAASSEGSNNTNNNESAAAAAVAAALSHHSSNRAAAAAAAASDVLRTSITNSHRSAESDANNNNNSSNNASRGGGGPRSSSSLRSSSGSRNSTKSVSFFRTILGQHRQATNVDYHADGSATFSAPHQHAAAAENELSETDGDERQTTSGRGASSRRGGGGGAKLRAGGRDRRRALVGRPQHGTLASTHPSIAEGGGGGEGSGGGVGGEGGEGVVVVGEARNNNKSCWQRCFGASSYCLCTPHHRKHLAASCLGSKPWRVVLCFFTVMLLFGPECRELFFPKQADLAFDVIFMCGFIIFCLDICMRMDVEPNYFVMCHMSNVNCFSWCRIRNQQRRAGRGGGGGGLVNDGYGEIMNTPGSGGGGGGGTSSCWPTCANLQCGSFIFWCELASTCSLLYEISFINKKHFQQERIQIGLDQFGIPVSFSLSIYPALSRPTTTRLSFKFDDAYVLTRSYAIL